MTYIPDALRQILFSLAKRRCEYCQAQKAIIVTLEIDHIMPLSLGGQTELDNLTSVMDKPICIYPHPPTPSPRCGEGE